MEARPGPCIIIRCRRYAIGEGMDEVAFRQLTDWVTDAGLAGEPELTIVTGLCERVVAAGLPIARATSSSMRSIRCTRATCSGGATISMSRPRSSTVDYRDRASRTLWRRRSRSTGGSSSGRVCRSTDGAPLLPHAGDRPVVAAPPPVAEHGTDFSVFPDLREAGLTDYVAIISRFAAPRVIGDMDGVYSSWISRAPDGFEDADIAAFERIAPFLALAIKSVTLARMTGTLMKPIQPRRRQACAQWADRARRRRPYRCGALVQRFARLHAVTDTEPQHVIPLLNDYADVIVSAIDQRGGDVLKLMGDGTLAIFTAGGRAEASKAALEASIAARRGVAALNARRAAGGLPVTDMYRPARRRGVLWQRRQHGTARFHGDRAGGQRGQPDRGDAPVG